ncbi:uncharacterized protein SRS1_15724 [Sporisorium reilianum f. sp. reilianum]|uniref:INO80 complex subunit F domain-containing protein n=1 Tax=Sporisorium reilianum f. sp. reilianum TaxID=72559 RepID=A0A2N8UKL1_9BASI|nr:uncharacterized protein SRS1_15724 [Sporisorium reilianum f. sp. reilianum]
MSAPTPATQPVKTKSKAYSSTVAIQGDAAKYRLKYKELKKKVREIEVENDKLHLKTLGIKRNIQRMRLERAILYERLEAESQATPGVAAYPPAQHYELDARRDDPYAAAPGSSSGMARGGYGDAAYGATSAGASSSAYRHPPPSSASVAAAAAPSARASYGSTYDDYPPPPPPPARSHPHPSAHPHAHARPYAPSSSYDSRHHSPQPPPPASSTGDRAERLRQYTESPSPEAASRHADVRGATPPLAARSADAAGSAADAGGLSSSASRSTMKVTLRRGA